MSPIVSGLCRGQAGEDRVITEFRSDRSPLRLKYVRDHNVRALGSEAARVAGTHSTGTARDDHRPIVETSHDSLVQFGYEHRAHASQRLHLLDL
jgi:hypothetical protein